MEEDSSSSISSSSEPNFTHKPPSTLSLTYLLNLESQIISSLFSSFFSLFKHSSPTPTPVDFNGPISTPGGGIARRVAARLFGAAYVCFVLSMLMILAVILGVGLVGLWVEEPVCRNRSSEFRNDGDAFPTRRRKMTYAFGRCVYPTYAFGRCVCPTLCEVRIWEMRM